MTLLLLDDTLKVDVFFEKNDEGYADNICLRIVESCPDEERLFRAEETNLYLTSLQACTLAKLLNAAARCSMDLNIP